MRRFLGVLIDKRGVDFNEGGYFLTFCWDRNIRMLRLWFKPDFWKKGPALYERIFKY